MILEPLDLTTFAITIHPLVPFANVNLLHLSFEWHNLLLLSSFYCLHCEGCSFYFSIHCQDHYSTNHHQLSLCFFIKHCVWITFHVQKSHNVVNNFSLNCDARKWQCSGFWKNVQSFIYSGHSTCVLSKWCCHNLDFHYVCATNYCK